MFGATVEIYILEFVGTMSVKKNAPLILNCLLKLLEVENVGATWMLLYPHNEKAVPLIVFYPQSKHFLIHLFAFLK